MPVEADRKVFLVGEADRLVPQESSPEAANALLKLLEEPPANTWIIPTTTEQELVLPTIRCAPSRSGCRACRRRRPAFAPAGSDKADVDARALLERASWTRRRFRAKPQTGPGRHEEDSRIYSTPWPASSPGECESGPIATRPSGSAGARTSPDGAGRSAET
jgi:hypothetical protein